MRQPLLACALMLCTGCATGYRAGGNGGGFSETKLSNSQWQIRFEGNRKTRQDRAAQFLLRRSAEITLEQGARYFALTTLGQATSAGRGRRYANGQAQIHVLSERHGDALDAVVVVKETNKIAKGRLSEAARITLARVRSP